MSDVTGIDGSKFSEIQEAADRLVVACERQGIPFFFIAKHPVDGYVATTCQDVGDIDSTIANHALLGKSKNFDEFMSEVIEQSRVKGHDSVYIRAMGIDYNPAANPLDE